MIEADTGIVIRLRRFSETSLIVNWLTRDSGRVDTLAKGALRPKSLFRGKLDLFYEARFSFLRSRRSGLHTLRETILVEPHAALRRDLGRLRQASYCAALIEQTTEKEAPLEGCYQMLRNILEALARSALPAATLFAFELKLLAELGVKPDLRESRLSAGARRAAALLLANDWASISVLKLSRAQAVEISRFLQGFMIYHLGRMPPGRDAALTILPISSRVCDKNVEGQE